MAWEVAREAVCRGRRADARRWPHWCSSYAIIEHLYFPKFSASPDPLSLFCKVAPRTKQIRFRAILPVLPCRNPTVLASRIAAAVILLEGRYQFIVARDHGIPPKTGVRLFLGDKSDST